MADVEMDNQEGCELRLPRVMVFSADDALFGFHCEGVEAVYDKTSISLHSVKTRAGGWSSFLLHDSEPALVIDVRDAFDLGDVLGETERAAYLVVRVGESRVAIGADACLGVRQLDLQTQIPVPTNLTRENGISVGHLVGLDDAILTLLNPAQLLNRAERAVLAPAMKAAKLFKQREQKICGLWEDLCGQPTEASLRAYARLCRRNGHSKTAAAARRLLKCYGEAARAAGSDEFNSESPGDDIVRDILTLSMAKRSGQIEFDAEDGSEAGWIFLNDGRVVDAASGGAWGRRAFRELVGLQGARHRFAEADTTSRPTTISESTVALLVKSLEVLEGEKRGRRSR